MLVPVLPQSRKISFHLVIHAKGTHVVWIFEIYISLSIYNPFIVYICLAMPILSSLVSPDDIVMTTLGAAGDDSVGFP